MASINRKVSLFTSEFCKHPEPEQHTGGFLARYFSGTVLRENHLEVCRGIECSKKFCEQTFCVSGLEPQLPLLLR